MLDFDLHVIELGIGALRALLLLFKATIMIVHGDRKDLLRLVMANHVLIEKLLDILGIRHGTQLGELLLLGRDILPLRLANDRRYLLRAIDAYIGPGGAGDYNDFIRVAAAEAATDLRIFLHFFWERTLSIRPYSAASSALMK